MKRFFTLVVIAASTWALIPRPAPGAEDEPAAGPPAPEKNETDSANKTQAEKKPLRLSLEDLTRRALSNSHSLAAERHRLAAMEAKVEQAFWAPFSKFTLGGAFTMVPDKCFDTTALEEDGVLRDCEGGAVEAEENWMKKEWGPSFHLELKGGVPIYTFGKISSAKDALGHARDAKEANLPALRNRIRADVARAYHAIIGAREMLYTIGEGRKHLVKARKRLERDLEKQEGNETQVDLIKLKVFESEIDHLESQTRKIEQTALAALRFLAGGPDAERLDVPDVPQQRVERELEPLEEYLDRSLHHRPELKAIKLAVKALESKVDLQRAQFWPDLAIVLSLRYGYTPGRTDVRNWVLEDNYNYGNWIPGVALSLKYDLDWGLDIYRLDEAKAELTALVAERQEALDAVLLEVRTTYLEVSGSRDSIEDLERSKRLVKGWIAAVTQGHAAGLNSSKDVKDALKEYFKVMAEMHQSIGEYNAGLAELDRVTGITEEPEKRER
ncbi:MAG: TolC family protein [Polyangia bacterium]